MQQNFAIAIHGGAGTIGKDKMTSSLEKQYRDALQEALKAGIEVLEQGASALEAVEASVIVLEDCPLFNAGKGAVFNDEGTHEMDAAIMDGKDLRAGAVAGITHIKNPVKLAKLVMEKTKYVFLGGTGAETFAREQQLPFETAGYFYTDQRFEEWRSRATNGAIPSKKIATVGAVARDVQGNLAAATSTGGLTGKKYGRIGDSPVIGSGTFACNDTCAISCTGDGEQFIRAVTAYNVSCLIEYGNLTLQEACQRSLQGRWASIGGSGGLIAVDKNGNIAMPFNTEGMYRACRGLNGNTEINIFEE